MWRHTRNAGVKDALEKTQPAIACSVAHWPHLKKISHRINGTADPSWTVLKRGINLPAL
jgi:hypothetical protein